MELVTDGQYYAIRRRSTMGGASYKNLRGEGWLTDVSMRAMQLCWGTEAEARSMADQMRQSYGITVIEKL